MTATAIFTVQYIAYPEWLYKMHFLAQLFKQTQKESTVVLQRQTKFPATSYVCPGSSLGQYIMQITLVTNQTQE